MRIRPDTLDSSQFQFATTVDDHKLIMRRLWAMDYAQGAYVGTTDDGTDLYQGAPGTGFVDENGVGLSGIASGEGITTASGQQTSFGGLLNQISPPPSGGGAVPPILSPPTYSGSTPASSNTSTSTAIAAIGTSFASLAQAIGGVVNPPQAINPRTGLPYTQAQLQALAATSQQSVLGYNVGSFLPIVLVGLIIWVLIKK